MLDSGSAPDKDRADGSTETFGEAEGNRVNGTTILLEGSSPSGD
jgi:hypothetical protein